MKKITAIIFAAAMLCMLAFGCAAENEPAADVSGSDVSVSDLSATDLSGSDLSASDAE